MNEAKESKKKSKRKTKAESKTESKRDNHQTCYICLDDSQHWLIKSPCRTCKYKVHMYCLRKSIIQSNSNICTICHNTFPEHYNRYLHEECVDVESEEDITPSTPQNTPEFSFMENKYLITYLIYVVFILAFISHMYVVYNQFSIWFIAAIISLSLLSILLAIIISFMYIKNQRIAQSL